MKRAFSRKNLWDKTPAAAKKALGAALSLVPLPYLLGRDFRRWYKFACEADRWGAEQAREYQLGELKRILALAYEKTEFYRESFRRVGFEPGDLKQPEDLQGLPTIDKATIRENWQRMLTRPITDPDVDMVTTGGTSGEPLRFYMSSSRHAREFAHLCACWKRVGYQPGDTMAVLRGRVITSSHHGMHYEHDPLLRHHYYSTYHMSPGDMSRYAAHIHTTRPSFVHAYPSALFTFTSYLASQKQRMPSSIRAVFLESEPIVPAQRMLFESHLGLPVLASYGLSEKVVLAAECETVHDYHVSPTYSYVEVLNSEGHSVAQAGRGDVTGTGFLDCVMPMIRYRTGDEATFSSRKCSTCERQQLLLTNLVPRRGRELIVCRDRHTLISMAALTGGRFLYDESFCGVLRFQFIQDEPGKALLKLVTLSGQRGPSVDRLQKLFDTKLGHCVDLQIEVVRQISLTPVGKQLMVLQRWPGIAALLRDQGEK